MFHSQTTLVLAAFLFVLLPLLVWWVTAGQQREALGWWCTGSLLAAAGLTLMVLRPWLPAWASYNLGNSGLLMCVVSWAQSLRLLQGRGWSLAQMGLWALLALAYYSLLLAWAAADTRGLGMRMALGALALYTAWLTVPLVRRWRSHNAAVIGTCYALLGLGLWSQALLHGGGGSQPSPFSNTWDASMIALLTLVTSAVGHLCFTGLVIDHSMQAQLKAERARVATRETGRLQAQLRQHDRQQRLLLVSGALAHELNQPLTVALTQAQIAQRLLDKHEAKPEALQPQLTKVQRALERTSAVLERIRSDGESQALRLQPLNLREQLALATRWFQPEWERLGVQVLMPADGPALWCRADEVALSQVLLNLLRNATEAVQESQDKSIELFCETDEQRVCLLVRDRGPGVPQAVLGQWGEPFVSSRSQGLGMGLAISRSIMSQLGGELRLCNRPEGGAQASVCLPRLEVSKPC